MPATRRTLVGLHLFNALSAVGGGIALLAGGLGIPTALLRHTPFDSFVVPGIFLAAVIGGSATIGATALLAHWRRALITSAAAGAIMVGWILGETLLVEGFSWLQGLYLLTGSIVVVASIRLSKATTAPPAPRTVFPARSQEGLR
jgi:large exoprotein involved in heme utilization and adhesion